MNLYSTTGAFVPKAAKRGSKSAAKTPLVLVAKGEVRKAILNDKDTAAYLAAKTDEQRAEVLARKTVNASTLDGTRVSVSTAALAEFRQRVLASLPALADDADDDARHAHALAASTIVSGIFRSGAILLISSAEVDDTDAIALSLFEDDAS